MEVCGNGRTGLCVHALDGIPLQCRVAPCVGGNATHVAGTYMYLHKQSPSLPPALVCRSGPPGGQRLSPQPLGGLQ